MAKKLKRKRKIFTALGLLVLLVGLVFFLFSGDNRAVLSELVRDNVSKEEIQDTLGKLGFKGSAYKDKNEKGLQEGWHFEGMELTAEFLNSKVKELVDTKDMKGSLIKVFKELELKKLNNLLEGEAEQVKVAWSALEQLEEQKKNMMYVLDKTEIKELEKQISTLTEKVKTKIQNCVNLLERQKKLLAKDAKKGIGKISA